MGRRARRFVFGTLAILLAAGCESYKGKMYWIGTAPRFEVSTECRDAEAGASGPVALRVVTLDETGAPLPGATVKVGGPRGSSVAAVRVETDGRGEAEVSVEPGMWQIDAALAGFKPGRYVLDLPKGKTCVVRFTLLAEGDAVIAF
jgi:hypothetical protein